MLVSVSIREVAILAQKNQRTIRRWCQMGFVSGAWCSPGGHWRLRVSILKADRARARALARRSKDYAGEIAGLVMAKAVAALRPPAGFDRGKPPTAEAFKAADVEAAADLARAGYRAFPVAVAERVAAVGEFAESRGGAANSLLQQLPAIRRAGWWLAFSAGDGELSPAHDAAIAGVQHGKPLFVAAYGAARLLLANDSRCSVAAVCRKLGLSRASVYRRGQIADVKAGVAQARVEEKATRRGDAWSAQVGRVAGGGDIGRRVNTRHDVEDDGADD